MAKKKAAKKKVAKKAVKAKKATVARTKSKKVAKKTVKPTKAAAPARGKLVYSFGDGKAEGRADMRNLLGGKGANLAEMSNIGLPVPPGLTITTEVCTAYYKNGKQYPKE
ncbi:MAG: PEP/pyruvate-binding domain-containing protein, partial [Ferrovibrio sp.]